MVDVTITIPNDKLDELKLGFLTVYPKNTGETDLQCFRRFIREKVLDYYRTGKIELARETTSPYFEDGLIDEG